MQDNVYPEEEFNKIQFEVMGSNFPWYVQESGVSTNVTDDGYGFQFTHQLRNIDGSTSSYNNLFSDLYMRLGVKKLLRSKINLLYRTKNIHEFKPFHIDIESNWLGNQQWTTAIFYINTNDGYTVFEDGTKINSVANRICIFPHWMKHSGTTCTNTNRRIALNLNFVR